jgi:deoxycytidylate deaminase
MLKIVSDEAYDCRMSHDPELVIGLVGAIGTDLRAASEAIARRLSSVGYTATEVHVSGLLHEIDRYSSLAAIHDREVYYDEHMNKGNELCEAVMREDAMALLAILQVRTWRDEKQTSDAIAAAPRRAFLINSLKRPKEIQTLKETYGDAFVLVGAYASRDTRRDTLASKIARSKNKEASQCRAIAERLITRDESESTTFGQDVSHTFFRADAFIDASERTGIDSSIGRFIDILFGHPFETPTRDEIGMQQAFSAALRSADLSRQVGAAICTVDGQLIATGTNEVPKAGGGLYWPGEHDQRDFRFADRDEPNAEMKRLILADLLERMTRLDLLAPGVVIDDARIESLALSELKDSRLMNITEYGRAVHAEMAAITDAARRGVSVAGSVLFCTTFPCHNCAKHIVAAGIRQVVYIEPYPKSEVARLFSDSIVLDRQPLANHVAFSPFVGFAPTRFADFFEMRKRVDGDKHILNWETIRRTAQPRIAGTPAAYLTNELAMVEEIKKKMTSAGLQLSKGGAA